MRAQPEKVAGNPVELRQNNARCLGACRGFSADQSFDCEAIAESIRHRRDVIHPVDVRREHRVGAVFRNLLHSAMQIADDALHVFDAFAIELQHDTQHAMRRWVLRTHVEDEFGRIEIVRFFGGPLVHRPLSIPRFF
jgi:hypothetical protein